MMRKHMIASWFLLFSIIAAGPASVASASESRVEPYAAKFAYTPASQLPHGSGGATFAVTTSINFTPCNIDNEFWKRELEALKKGNAASGKMFWFMFPQFNDLIASSGNNFSALLAAKGFNIRGPFDSLDGLTYSDKQAIDFIANPSFAITLTHTQQKEGSDFSGTIEVDGKLTLELREPATNELMWTKSVPLTKFEVSYDLGTMYRNDDKFNTIMNDVAKGIEKQYPAMMDRLSNLIDPQEIKILKRQAQGLKKKKGY